MPDRPHISWRDLRGATVGVWGLGVEGRANLRRLRAEGATPILVDDHPPSEPVDGGMPVLATASGGMDALARCDAVIKTPGISRYRPEVRRLETAGVPVVGGLGLWLESVRAAGDVQVACVTGTKGKSTTTAICGHLLAGLGCDAGVGGNLGRPPYDPGAGEHARWVVETSSFQATDLSVSPPVVVVTSLHPDHLDWHGDVETYYRDKLSACSQPGAGVAIADATSPALRAHQALLGPHPEWATPPPPGSRGTRWTEALGLLGEHNRRNALLAQRCLLAMGVPEASDEEALAAAAAGFPGLDSRLQLVATVAGVNLVDDSLSTNVLPAVAALASFPTRRVALLAGGYDRGIDYGPLAEALLAREVPSMLATLPANGPRIRQAVAVAGGGAGSQVTAADFPDLPAAVSAAFAWARPDGVVLLSPAAPSFGQFRDYRERSAAFRDAVAVLAATAGPARS